MQLFLPPFAQVLPSAQSVAAVYGATPWRRFSFVSPTQSTSPSDIAQYGASLGRSPRMPFLGAPFGSGYRIGSGLNHVTFFLPMAYHDLTFEPSLLSGPVTVVGKIVAFAVTRRKVYIDYPTISEFAPALLKASETFDDRLGVCSTDPPRAVLKKSSTGHELPGISSRTVEKCTSPHAVLAAIKRSVTLRAPYVVVLPLAVYQ
jgi:hypothetical protein